MQGSRRALLQASLRNLARAASESPNLAPSASRSLDCIGQVRQSLIHHGGVEGGPFRRLFHVSTLCGSHSGRLLLRPGGSAVSHFSSVARCAEGGIGVKSFSEIASKGVEQRSITAAYRQAGLALKKNFSSSDNPAWSQRWKETTEKVKEALNLKPRKGSGMNLKVSSAMPSRAKEAIAPVQRTFTQYREAGRLQLEAFWKRNYMIVVGLVGAGVCLLLWRLMFGIASTFISMSEGLAKFGFLALAASMVIVGGVVLRGKYTINPDAAYRMAMRKLNSSAAVLEVMGAPLSGTDLRAYVMSGGGLRFKGLKPRLAGKRCFIIFPIRGSERKGLVSLEVKKKKGKYDFKLLAVDVPTARGEQRLFLVGDESEYQVGGGLISELRDPMVRAMAAQKEFEDQDLEEEEEDERREAQVQQEMLHKELEELEKERKGALNQLNEHEERVREEVASEEQQKKERILA